jgi:putative oxygen-independent coproporphyrinogen III oxidase
LERESGYYAGPILGCQGEPLDRPGSRPADRPIFPAVHLYFHIPFCARRCSYCDFAIAVRRSIPSARYADLVLREWSRWQGASLWAEFHELATVYLGGGTPSRLAPGELARILARVQQDRPLRPGAEVTLEANPEDVTPEAARAWRGAGITRVSLGVQSFDPGVLDWMHRTHSAAQVPVAVATLREAGIPALSLDLIYALPSELSRDWARDLDQALALEPDHLSLYGLTVERHTPLGRWVDRGDTHAAPDERYATEFLLAHERLTTAGFRHYEVSNYGRPGQEAVHNSAYWRRAPFLGLGPSAHSGIEARRWWNLREWSAWEAAMAEGLPVVAGQESLDAAALALEALYLGLRTSEGVAATLLPHDLLETWVHEGWARSEAGRLKLTAEGWLRLDALVAHAARAADRLPG